MSTLPKVTGSVTRVDSDTCATLVMTSTSADGDLCNYGSASELAFSGKPYLDEAAIAGTGIGVCLRNLARAWPSCYDHVGVWPPYSKLMEALAAPHVSLGAQRRLIACPATSLCSTSSATSRRNL